MRVLWKTRLAKFLKSTGQNLKPALQLFNSTARNYKPALRVSSSSAWVAILAPLPLQ